MEARAAIQLASEEPAADRLAGLPTAFERIPRLSDADRAETPPLRRGHLPPKGRPWKLRGFALCFGYLFFHGRFERWQRELGVAVLLTAAWPWAGRSVLPGYVGWLPPRTSG